MKTAREIIAETIETPPIEMPTPDMVIGRLAAEGFSIVPTADLERLTEKAIVGEYMWTPKELHEAIQETREACAKEAESEIVPIYEDSPAEIDVECNKVCRNIAQAIRALGATHG